MKKILVIEDNFEVRENLAEILEISDYAVVTAGDGIQGVETALKEHPDLILCDVMMPRLDGFGVLRILSQKPATSDIPFIFLTAKSDKEDFRLGMNLGADDYITKPFEHKELLDAIDIRLKKSERLEKLFEQNPLENKTLLDEARGQKELEKLAQAKEIRRYRNRDYLFSEGDSPKYLFYVVCGKVKAYRTNEFGKDYITEIYKKGDFLGFHPLINGVSYHESAAVMEDTEICLIPKDDFFELLSGSPDFTARFIKLLSKNITEKEEELLRLAYNSTRKRVADALIKLHHKFNETGSHPISILRDDLASMVGTTKESVSRMLTDFKSENLIDVDSHGAITVLKEQDLEEIPN
jgi:CRP-like cAMP-binding protein